MTVQDARLTVPRLEQRQVVRRLVCLKLSNQLEYHFFLSIAVESWGYSSSFAPKIFCSSCIANYQSTSETIMNSKYQMQWNTPELVIVNPVSLLVDERA